MTIDSSNVLEMIDDYVTSNSEIIDSEYSKVADNCRDKNSEYGLEIANIYKKFLEYDGYIFDDILELWDTDDIHVQISLFQNIFQSFHKIKEIVEKFKKVKQNFYMNK